MPKIAVKVIKPKRVVAMIKHGFARSRGKARDRIKHIARSIM